MEAFFQGLQTNSSVLVVLVVLFFIIIKQGHKTEMSFQDIRAQLRIINDQLKKHSRDIKRLKKNK